MPLTRQQWKEIEQTLSQPYGHVRLQVDQFQLSLQSTVIDRKVVVLWYLNGGWKGSYCFTDCEERRRFARPSVKKLFSAKVRKGVSKRLSKRLGIDQEVTSYRWAWNSPSALRRHLIKNNTSIELAAAEPV